MSYETILFDLTNNAARLTLNRPDRLNSFNVQMHAEIAEALTAVERNADIRALLITGAGRGFCAGQDLSDRAVAPGSAGVDLGESLENRYNPLVRRRRIAEARRVRGESVAATPSEHRIRCRHRAGRKKSARFIQAFANIGLVPDSGGTWILPRLAGQPRAMALALTGEPLSAEKAEAWGLIWRAVDDAELQAEATKLVERLANGPTKGLGATKLAIRKSWSQSLDSQLDLERDLQRELGRSHDYGEGVAAFGEKRTPKFTGR
jgi:2-(1,2-epoxy-1,2-dihydrophenyl)acetyl-CoA isomerase